MPPGPWVGTSRGDDGIVEVVGEDGVEVLGYAIAGIRLTVNVRYGQDEVD